MLLTSFLILAVIAALVLFGMDHSWSNVTLASRNDLVFDKKNKKYGAYQIRSEYNSTLLLSLIATIIGTLAVFLAPMFFKLTRENTNKIIPGEPVTIKEYQIFDREIIIPQPLSKAAPAAPAKQAPEKTEPEIVTNSQAADPVSTANPAGAAPASAGGENSSSSADPGPITAAAAVPAIEYPDIMPEFPGGYNAMLQYFASHVRYPQAELEKGIQGIVYISFVVDENGNISNVKELHGLKGGPNLTSEAIRVVKSMPRWKPGKVNNKAVPVQFKLPVRFALR